MLNKSHNLKTVGEADFVIIGAGSAGSALAYRLSESGQDSVLVIESGGSDAGPLIQMPGALSMPMNMSRYDWGFKSEPEPHLDHRHLAAPRGKVLGGSSSINGMVYVRGNSGDFDRWSQLGAHGWAYNNVLPYFRRMEQLVGRDPAIRGFEGPLRVQSACAENTLTKVFLRAGREAGHEWTHDYNGAAQEGICVFEQTIHRGRRWSTANAYLRPALKRPNVGIVKGLAKRLVFEGRQCVGVSIGQGPQAGIVRARREIIVCASAFNSPLLLMHSGIGPADELAQKGIEIVANRPGVGKNLQDHLEVYIQQACKLPVSLNGNLNWFSKALIGLQWLLRRDGLGASNHFEAGAFLRSSKDIPYPDIQFHFLPAAVRYDGTAAVDGHGYQVHVGPMLSKSRGQVTPRSARAEDGPVIQFNYMSHEEDWQIFRRAIRMARQILAQAAFDPYRGAELSPGTQAVSDAELDAFIRAEAESAYHPCGTCKMGQADDNQAVVDPECRVIGVEGLRVADSSIFPHITNGNTNAPSIMVGEKAADHLLGRSMLSSV